MRLAENFMFFFFATSLINSIMQDGECEFCLSFGIKIALKSYFRREKLRFCHCVCNVIVDVIS